MIRPALALDEEGHGKADRARDQHRDGAIAAIVLQQKDRKQHAEPARRALGLDHERPLAPHRHVDIARDGQHHGEKFREQRGDADNIGKHRNARNPVFRNEHDAP